MTDHKFTDEELQRCIECCIKGKVWGDCKKLNCPAIRKQGCHFYLRTDDDYENTIYIEILKDALALINRQKAQIESLQAVHADMTESLRLAAEANKDMQAEIKKLKGSRNRWKQIATDFDKASRETEKEIERLYKEIERISKMTVETNVKEMTEELK